MDGKIPKNDEIFDGLKDCLENFGKLKDLVEKWIDMN
jgi:hypothetical protein